MKQDVATKELNTGGEQLNTGGSLAKSDTNTRKASIRSGVRSKRVAKPKNLTGIEAENSASKDLLSVETENSISKEKESVIVNDSKVEEIGTIDDSKVEKSGTSGDSKEKESAVVDDNPDSRPEEDYQSSSERVTAEELVCSPEEEKLDQVFLSSNEAPPKEWGENCPPKVERRQVYLCDVQPPRPEKSSRVTATLRTYSKPSDGAPSDPVGQHYELLSKVAPQPPPRIPTRTKVPGSQGAIVHKGARPRTNAISLPQVSVSGLEKGGSLNRGISNEGSRG